MLIFYTIEEHRYEKRNLRMSTDTIIAALSALFSLISAVMAFKANKNSKTANKIAEEANKHAIEANDIAKESQNNEVFLNVSKFRVKLETVQFSNDAYLYMCAKDAVQNGVLACEFSVENISNNDAYSVRMGAIDEKFKDILSKKKVKMPCSIVGRCSVLKGPTYHQDYDNDSTNPKSGNVQKDGYMFMNKLYLKIGEYTYSCHVKFECLVQNNGSREFPQWTICPFNDEECCVLDYHQENQAISSME